MTARVCTECGGSLAHRDPKAKTCGANCRGKRSRRLKRNSEQRDTTTDLTPEQREWTERVRSEIPDAAHEVAREELRPIVREAITEDTLRALNRLVGLAPAAVTAIEQDLSSENDTIRQRAYTLLVKYTIGHPAVVQPTDSVSGEMTVNFNLPRPSDAPDLPAIEVKAVTLVTCDTCGEEKPSDEMAANSTRCMTCYERQRSKVNELLGD